MRPNRRTALSTGLATLALGVAGRPEASPMDDALSVAIAVPEHRGARTLIDEDERSHFHVTLRNVSSRPVTIWREWCSFGYNNLSFEGRTGSGAKISARKRPVPFLQNVPDPVTLAPGEIMVYHVAFRSDEWEGFPRPEAGTHAVVTLRAVFAIPETPQATQHGVWTGRVESDAREYRIESRAK